MLPRNFDADTENHHFLRDERSGFHLVFVSREAKKQNPFVPHWVGTFGDAAALQAMCRWTSIRRDLWQEWGSLAERIGHQAFAEHMDALLTAEPLVHVAGAMIQRRDDPAQVAIGETVLGAGGLRLEVLHVHTFPSAAACEALHEWFGTGENHEAAGSLLNIAYWQGTDALGAALDRIANEYAVKPRRAPRAAADRAARTGGMENRRSETRGRRDRPSSLAAVGATAIHSS